VNESAKSFEFDPGEVTKVLDKNNPLKEPLKVEKDAPVRNVLRFWLIALTVTVVGLLVIGLIFGRLGIQR
jgi:plastocyanin domain-containing protein